jgi:ABC-2 type transport system permease protein
VADITAADFTVAADDRPGLRELATIWRRLVGARIRADWQYRTSFVLFTVSQFCTSFLDLSAILILFANVDRLAGWSVAEAAFLYGTSATAFALADVFVSEVELLSVHVRRGTFDQLLIRPLGPLFQMCCREFAFRRTGKLLQAVAVLAVAADRVNVDWNVTRVAMVAVMIVVGAVIFSAIWVLTSSIAFWAVEMREVANSFTYGGSFVTRYPLEIFAGWLRRLVVLVPLAFVNYYPTLWVLGRRDPDGAAGWLAFAGPAVAALVTLGAACVWSSGLRHYRSTGS